MAVTSTVTSTGSLDLLPPPPLNPQGPSSADNSGHGSNRSGSYTSVHRNDTGHGNGGNGKLAAGSGRADNKNPRGQFPGDNNNGYECDKNSGVGQKNPAHSGCFRPPQTNQGQPGTPGAPTVGGITGSTPTPGRPSTPSPTSVQGVLLQRPTTVAGAPPVSSDELPRTGMGSMDLLLLLALGLIGLGLVLTGAGRRPLPVLPHYGGILLVRGDGVLRLERRVASATGPGWCQSRAWLHGHRRRR